MIVRDGRRDGSRSSRAASNRRSRLTSESRLVLRRSVGESHRSRETVDSLHLGESSKLICFLSESVERNRRAKRKGGRVSFGLSFKRRTKRSRRKNLVYSPNESIPSTSTSSRIQHDLRAPRARERLPWSSFCFSSRRRIQEQLDEISFSNLWCQISDEDAVLSLGRDIRHLSRVDGGRVRRGGGRGSPVRFERSRRVGHEDGRVGRSWSEGVEDSRGEMSGLVEEKRGR